MDFSQLSILAIILAVIANMIIGALWYSPVLICENMDEEPREKHGRTSDIQCKYRLRAYDTCWHHFCNRSITIYFDARFGHHRRRGVNRIFSWCRNRERTRIVANLF